MIINPKSKNEYSQNSEEIIAMDLLSNVRQRFVESNERIINGKKSNKQPSSKGKEIKK